VHKIVIIFGGIICGVSGVLFVNAVRRGFWIEAADVIRDLLLPSLVLIVGAAVIIIGAVLGKKLKRNAARNARTAADAHVTRAYNYTTANEALVARAAAWEAETWDNAIKRTEAVNALRRLAKDVNSLEQVSDSVTLALSKELKYSVLGAIARIDDAILQNLSRFILYCVKATSFELSGEHFTSTYSMVANEVTLALDRYARLHTKLTQINLCKHDDKEYEKFKAEIDSI
jgi:predicted RND superfamily exporter protein